MTVITGKRRRLTPDVRREEILTTASQLLAERGFNGITIQEVADAAGMAKSGVLHHFPNKNTLLIELLAYRDKTDMTVAEVASVPYLSPEEGRALIDKVVRRNFERREIVRLYTVLGIEALDPDHPAHEYFNRRLSDTRELLRSATAVLHDDPELVVLEIIAFLDGLQALWLRDESIPFLALWKKFADRLFGV
jgi:AcrR family transcriptional regulator